MMIDVIVARLGGPETAEGDEWMFHATILDGSERHELSVSCPTGRFSDTVRLVIAEAFRLGKEAR